MLIRWLFRLLIGVGFAVPLMLVTVAFVTATDQPAPVETDSCYLCHSDTFQVWKEGAHGRAASEEAFMALWEAQDQPKRCLACHTTGYDPATGTYTAAGVTCESCHGPIPKDHPDEPVQTDRTAKTCGTCHTDTMLEWQVSQHREQNLTCASCHDPHAAELKAESASALCATCHKDQTARFSHTSHSKADVDCASCHLAPVADIASEGHAYRDHSFNVKLSTCNECHAERMHEPVAMPMSQPTTAAPDVMASAETMGVSTAPEPVSPLGFTALAGALGLGLGLVVAPWLERWYHGREPRQR